MTETAPVRFAATSSAAGNFPLLQNLLAAKGLTDNGLWTVRDVAKLFGVHARTIQQWTRDGKLMSRDLPGRARFLAEDLEAFLRASARAIDHEEI
jgi:excisionase family DNA binding protein